MNKTFYKILFAAALMGGAMTVTSCGDYSNTDNPTPAPTPTPTPTPTPQPSPEELIEQAKQLLADAQEDGAVVSVSFTYNGKTYTATFKRVNGVYMLQGTLGDNLDASLQEVEGQSAQDPDNFIFTIQNKTTGETLMQVFINTAEDTVEVKAVDQKITFSGVTVNNTAVVMTPTDPSTGSETVFVTGVALNKTSLELTEGETFTLEATIAPTDATNQNVTWESSKPAVASVDQNGKVTAQAEGEATITVTTNDGSKQATCTVKVNLLPSPTITDPDDYTPGENPF